MKTIGKRSLALFLLLTLLAALGRRRGKAARLRRRPAHRQPKAARLRESSRIL